MRCFVKRFGIIAFLATIGFSVIGCEMEVDNDYEQLNGVWDRGDIVVTFSDDAAVFTQINSNSDWKTVQDNGSIKIGDRKFRNIKKTDDLKWTCQALTFDTTTFVVKSWDDCTLTLSSNGRSLRAYTPTTTNPSTTYTKK